MRVVEVEGNICHWPWNSGVVDVFENQKKIEEEARELQGKAVKFARVTTEWVRILNGGVSVWRCCEASLRVTCQTQLWAV